MKIPEQNSAQDAFEALRSIFGIPPNTEEKPWQAVRPRHRIIPMTVDSTFGDIIERLGRSIEEALGDSDKDGAKGKDGSKGDEATARRPAEAPQKNGVFEVFAADNGTNVLTVPVPGARKEDVVLSFEQGALRNLLTIQWRRNLPDGTTREHETVIGTDSLVASAVVENGLLSLTMKPAVTGKTNIPVG